MLVDILHSPLFLLCVAGIALFIKCYFFMFFIFKSSKKDLYDIRPILLCGAIFGSLFGDIAWITNVLHDMNIVISFSFIRFIIRLGWCFTIMQYLCLSFFVESLIEKKFRLRYHHFLRMLASISIGAYFIYIALFSSVSQSHVSESYNLEIQMMRFALIYLFTIIVAPGLIKVFITLSKNPLPKILKKQFAIFTRFFFLPYIAFDFLQSYLFLFSNAKAIDNYPLESISTLLLSAAIYYCIKRIIWLRFLRLEDHVVSHPNRETLDRFKLIIERLSHVSSTQELEQVTRTFFNELLHIPLHAIRFLYSLPLPSPEHIQLSKSPIFIYDELDFDAFYQSDTDLEQQLYSLQTLHADILIPIIPEQSIFLVVDKDSKPHDCYTDVDRDNMLAFANYMASIIKLLNSKNAQSLLKERKRIYDDLRATHKETELFKESLHSFLRSYSSKKIGLLFYRNRRFVYANQDAQEFIPYDLNQAAGNRLYKLCKDLLRTIEHKNNSHSIYTHDDKNNPLVLCGVPAHNHHGTILLVMRPEIADIIAPQIHLLKDPNDWHYLLYLKSTDIGQRIDTFIPCDTRTFLHYKIAFIKKIVEHPHIYFDLLDEDIPQFIDIMHSIEEGRLVERFETARHTAQAEEMLFGLDPYVHGNKKTKGLIEQCSQGTIILQKADLLSHRCQEKLAEYFQYDFYRPHTSDRKIFTRASFIFSMSKPFLMLKTSHILNDQFAGEIEQYTFTFPALTSLDTQEREALIKGYARQAVAHENMRPLLSLTDKEVIKLVTNIPESLTELKKRIHNILLKKSHKAHLDQQEAIDPAFSLNDPLVVQAARLGRYALKDRKLLYLLWHKYKNQSKIAELLGVNRSSVHRRFKEFDLFQ